MSLGDYNIRGVLEEYQGVVQDSTDGYSGGDWVTVKSLWMKLDPGEGARDFSDGVLKDRVPCIVTIPYDQYCADNFGSEGNISKGWRIRTAHGDVIMVHSVRPETMRRKKLRIVGVFSALNTDQVGDFADDFTQDFNT